MNFKPTLWKTIASIIIFVIVDLFISSKVICFTPPIEFGACPPWYSYITDIQTIIASLVIALIVYVIWSLIQKKKF